MSQNEHHVEDLDAIVPPKRVMRLLGRDWSIGHFPMRKQIELSRLHASMAQDDDDNPRDFQTRMAEKAAELVAASSDGAVTADEILDGCTREQLDRAVVILQEVIYGKEAMERARQTVATRDNADPPNPPLSVGDQEKVDMARGQRPTG